MKLLGIADSLYDIECNRVVWSMVFGSIGFLFLFLPIFMGIYYIVPAKWRNSCLLLGSIVFYAIGSAANPKHTVLFLSSLLFNYLMGRLVEKSKSRGWFVMGVSTNVLLLGIFKYWFQTIPIGISFYSFQAIAYLCDVRRRTSEAEKSLVNFGVFLSMFPQLIAGPIVKYSEVCEQIRERSHSLPGFLEGLRVFVLGLGSKVLLANQIGLLWTQLSTIGYESISTPLAWLGLLAYTFQIYYDFWGYSLMAIGLGKMMGFELPKNFDSPYLSTSMTEFWRRWHMTLGSWFREYVYIPLGGSRNGTGKTYRNLAIVWLLTGIWHGASWNFALWGMVLFGLIAVEKAFLKRWLDRFPLLGHLYMTAVIPLSWAVFAITTWDDLTLFLGRLFGVGGITLGFAGDWFKYMQEYGVLLLVCLLFITRIPQKLWGRLAGTGIGQVVLTGIFAGAVYCLYLGLDNPFLYYQF